MTSTFARPTPPPFQSDISFSKNPLHSKLIETLNVYLIQLKTERLGENINAGAYQARLAECSDLTERLTMLTMRCRFLGGGLLMQLPIRPA